MEACEAELIRCLRAAETLVPQNLAKLIERQQGWLRHLAIFRRRSDSAHINKPKARLRTVYASHELIQPLYQMRLIEYFKCLSKKSAVISNMLRPRRSALGQNLRHQKPVPTSNISLYPVSSEAIPASVKYKFFYSLFTIKLRMIRDVAHEPAAPTLKPNYLTALSIAFLLLPRRQPTGRYRNQQ